MQSISGSKTSIAATPNMDARHLLILLYEKDGYRTVDELKAALVDAIRREQWPPSQPPRHLMNM
jgi:hypothetical protein